MLHSDITRSQASLSNGDTYFILLCITLLQASLSIVDACFLCYLLALTHDMQNYKYCSRRDSRVELISRRERHHQPRAEKEDPDRYIVSRRIRGGRDVEKYFLLTVATVQTEPRRAALDRGSTARPHAETYIPYLWLRVLSYFSRRCIHFSNYCSHHRQKINIHFILRFD